MFARTIPKKIKFRKKKDMAFENIALINRAIMGNLAGNSSIRKNWNGKFDGMSDSEIKSFRQLDDVLMQVDKEISLEKYDNELRMINEVYQLRTNISDYFSVILLILTIPIIVTLLIGYDESYWGMEASKITFGGFFFGIGISVFILLFIIPFIGIPLGVIINGGGRLKKEMSLILGIPIMHSKSFTTMGDTHQMDHYDHYNWSYRVMSSRRGSFRSSSGSTSSERASSSSGGGGGGGGGGGFDSGGSGGGGGGGGDF